MDDTRTSQILDKLRGGDRRSIGQADQVVQEVLDDPTLLPAIVAGMSSDDPLVRMRAADVAEKVTAARPELLQAHKDPILAAAEIDQQEVRWHVAQMLPRLKLCEAERARAVEILLAYLQDKSRIVKTFSMQALADLAEQDAALRPQVIEWIQGLVHTGSPAMQSRGRKLLRRLSR